MAQHLEAIEDALFATPAISNYLSMGGGPDREQMLIVLWAEEMTEIIDKMRERFPYIEIKYWQIKSVRANSVKPDAHGSVPEGREGDYT